MRRNYHTSSASTFWCLRTESEEAYLQKEGKGNNRKLENILYEGIHQMLLR